MRDPEQHLGSAAGVDEDQRGLVAFDQVGTFRPAHGARGARPRQPLPVSSISTGAAAPPATTISARFPCRRAARQLTRASDSPARPPSPTARWRASRRQPPQPRQPERQQVAALGGDHARSSSSTTRRREENRERRVVGRQQQRQLLGVVSSTSRRVVAPLPLPPRHRRVAGAGLDLDRQGPFRQWRFQVARDVHRERLQRRDVEGVQAAGALHAAAGGNELFFSSLPRTGST